MTTKKLLLYFPNSETDKPIVYHLVRDYDLVVNIFRAKVTPDEYGYLMLDITGTDENIARGLDFLSSFDVRISESDKGLTWDETRCTSCGNCFSHCPTDALHIEDPGTRKVAFDATVCIDCLSCIDNCPYGACSSIFRE